MFIFTINLEYLWSIFSNEICSRNKCHGDLDTINLKDKKLVYFKALVFIGKNILHSFFQKDFIAPNIYTQFLTCCQNFTM